MKFQTLTYWIGIGTALLAACVPIVICHSVAHGAILIVLSINAIGWILVAIFIWKRLLLLESYSIALQGRATDQKVKYLEEEIAEYLLRTAQLFRVGFSQSLDDYQRTGADLSSSLRGIAEIAYRELNAESVELSLYDQQNDVWSQAFLLGVPRSEQSLARESKESRPQVVRKEIKLAGTVFGALRVVISADAPRAAAEELLSLLAIQGGLMLVNSRYTEELLRMKQVSEESIRVKTGFLANLSHEIRGPLGTILNGVEISLDGLCGPVTDDQKEILGMIKKSGEHLLDLVNDVLDYAKVEAGKVLVTLSAMAVKPLLNDLSAVVRSQAHNKGHTVIVQPIVDDLGVICDKRHLRQMIINMLTNAIKYTQEKGTITISAERLPADRVKISVKDTGIGIPEAERHKVFGAFERVDDSYAMTQTGTGLGMPLTRRLAELNGGQADFDSTYGQGSTFWIILPATEIKQTASRDSDANAVTEKLAQGKGETILLVDNDEGARDILAKYLVDQGFAIEKAESGAQVLQLLRDKKIELMVVENELPDLQGAELVSAVRSYPKAQTLPIILLSSRAFVFDIEHYLKLGVDRCLSKPVELKVLASTARQLIDESRSLSH